MIRAIIMIAAPLCGGILVVSLLAAIFNPVRKQERSHGKEIAKPDR